MSPVKQVQINSANVRLIHHIHLQSTNQDAERTLQQAQPHFGEAEACPERPPQNLLQTAQVQPLHGSVLHYLHPRYARNDVRSVLVDQRQRLLGVDGLVTSKIEFDHVCPHSFHREGHIYFKSPRPSGRCLPRFILRAA